MVGFRFTAASYNPKCRCARAVWICPAAGLIRQSCCEGAVRPPRRWPGGFFQYVYHGAYQIIQYYVQKWRAPRPRHALASASHRATARVHLHVMEKIKHINNPIIYNR